MAIKLADVLLYLGVDADDLDEGLDDAREKTERWSNKLGKTTSMLVGGVVIGAATAAATAITAIGVSALNVSKDTEKAAAAMAASLAIPRDEAEELANVARNIYGNNFAESVTDAGDAVANVVRTLKLAADDPSLQTITEKAIALRDSFGEDVAESVSTAKTMMDSFGISADEAFDLMAAGYQRGLNRSDDLLDSINEYSVQFANGGATANEFFSIMDSGLQGGMLGTDKAADAFKEFRVRILDGSSTTADGLKQIGLNAEEMSAAIDNGSMDIVDAWNLVIGKLQETEDQSTLMQAGVALIGTQFEDLGQDAVLAMEITKDAFDDAGGAADQLNKRYETFGAGAAAVWRRLIVSISPITDELLEMANDSIPYLMAAFERFDQNVLPALIEFGHTVHSVVTSVMGFFRGLGETVDISGTDRFAYLKDWIDSNLPLVQNLIQTVLDNIKAFWDQNGKAIMAIVTNTFDTVFAIVDTVLKTALDLVTLVLQLLNGDFEAAGKTLVNIVTRIWDTLQTVIGNQLDNIRQLILGINWADLGKQMIMGMARGIAGAAQFLAAAATEAAQRAFDAAKNWLGIQSPSRRAAEEIGRPFSEGVGLGITQQLGAVARDVQVGLNGLIGEIPAPSFAGSGAGGGGVNVVVNQTFNGAVNGDEVRRGSQDGILAAMRNLGLK